MVCDEFTLVDLATVLVQHCRRYLVVELSEHIILQELDLDAKKPEAMYLWLFDAENDSILSCSTAKLSD
jgi:hypothetical protein